MKHSNILTIAAAQIAPVWGNRTATLDKIISSVGEAAERGAQMVAFGEALLPGYPFWLDFTGGAEFNSAKQKAMHAHYMAEAVDISSGDLLPLQQACAEKKIAVYLGTIERAADRGGHSLYCSMVYITELGEIGSVHRKLMPTYEERLAWSIGDGHGLVTHKLGAFTVGGLNCWENWMPLARASLYAQGENLHVACWPGSARNTEDITRFMAKEGRSFVLSVSALMELSDFPDDTPLLDEIKSKAPAQLVDGGSCLAGPDGNWIIEPVVGREGVFVADIDLVKVREERQNFDPMGHYSRPDITKLTVNRVRQSNVDFIDE